MTQEEYYNDESKHGGYVYVTLEEMVNNFMSNFTGDSEILGKVKRSKVIYYMKQGIKNFNFNALKEVKAVELSLNDTLDVILPMDYVNYVRISYVNQETGELMLLSANNSSPQAVSYLQDHTGEVLFDDDGYILEGTSMFSELNDQVKVRQFAPNKSDVTKNSNGTFDINTRSGKIHFSSENPERVIMLEYISDGLEFTNESDIKINKMIEMALYNFVNWQLLDKKLNVQEYIISRAKKNYDTTYRNSKISMMNVNVEETMLLLNGRKKRIK